MKLTYLHFIFFIVFSNFHLKAVEFKNLYKLETLVQYTLNSSRGGNIQTWIYKIKPNSDLAKSYNIDETKDKKRYTEFVKLTQLEHIIKKFGIHKVYETNKPPFGDVRFLVETKKGELYLFIEKTT